VLTFFGLIHGEAIGIGESPVVASAYLMVAIVLAGCAKFATATAPVEEEEHVHGAAPQPAE
jgi:adenine/guanine/hypoxanthine permease